jgi:hypothetical protein
MLSDNNRVLSNATRGKQAYVTERPSPIRHAFGTIRIRSLRHNEESISSKVIKDLWTKNRQQSCISLGIVVVTGSTSRKSNLGLL